jgi:hypothetical protein
MSTVFVTRKFQKSRVTCHLSSSTSRNSTLPISWHRNCSTAGHTHQKCVIIEVSCISWRSVFILRFKGMSPWTQRMTSYWNEVDPVKLHIVKARVERLHWVVTVALDICEWVSQSSTSWLGGIAPPPISLQLVGSRATTTIASDHHCFCTVGRE